MYKFNETSLRRLETCHTTLQNLMHEVIKHIDITIIQGHRTFEEHQIYRKRGATKVPYHKSKHSTKPSLAVDIAPWPIIWDDYKSFYFLGGLVKGLYLKNPDPAYAIRWGGDWDSDNDFNDQTFNDLVHFELYAA
jgi:peptidoglycan L-alanyl-D-glutamate endopeptidase CwlK